MENYIDEIKGLLALELWNIDADNEHLIELLEKCERTFRDEHLSRFDEGMPMPPDVQDLKRHMKDWLKLHPNNGYIEYVWDGEEWTELDQVAFLLKSWIDMIDSYYPAPQKEKTIVIEYTRNQAKEPQAAPSVESVKTIMPDFSHLESFDPGIPFDISALYTFLKNNGVIKNIDKGLFTDCIKHAYLSNIWQCANRHKLKCTIRRIKDKFPKAWIDKVAYYFIKDGIVKTTDKQKVKKQITAYDDKKIREFNLRLQDVLKQVETI